MRQTTKLRRRIEDDEILLAPGTYDPLMARLMAQAGFEAVEMNGAGVTYTTLAMPDLGLVTMTEMAERARRVADACDLPVICDADTGYGNALNVIRTGPGVRARGRRRHPTGGPGNPEAVRAFHGQDACNGRRDGR